MRQLTIIEVVYASINKMDKAARDFEKAIVLNPTVAVYQENLETTSSNSKAEVGANDDEKPTMQSEVSLKLMSSSLKH